MNYSSKMGLLAGTAIAASLLAACATTPPKLEAYKAMPIGSTWTYSQHNSGSYAAQWGATELQLQITKGERAWGGRQVNTYSSSQGIILAEPESGRWIAMIGPGDKLLLGYDPPLGYELPLEVGKTWTKSYRLTLATGQILSSDTSWKVENYGDVTVPAGTFQAFKVTCSFSTGVEQTTWFSPEVGNFVKVRESRTTGYRAGPGTTEQELVSFNVKK